MQAVRYHATGSPAEVLRLEDLPTPTPGPGEVLVRLTHRPINPSDLLEVRGRYGKRPALPAGAGNEGLGYVEALGPEVEHLAEGQRVVVLGAGSTWQTHLVARADDLYAVPDDVPDEAAAQLAVNPLTAWLLLDEHGLLQPGDWVIQTGGATTVGRLVIQLAAARGYRTVNLIRPQDDAAALEALGATVCIPTTPDADAKAIQQAIRTATDHASIRIGCDCVGGTVGAQALTALGESGSFLIYGLLSGQPVPVDGGALIFKRLTVRGVWRTRWAATVSPATRAAALDAVCAEIAAGRLALPVAATFDLSNITEAVRYRAGGDGKVLLVG